MKRHFSEVTACSVMGSKQMRAQNKIGAAPDARGASGYLEHQFITAPGGRGTGMGAATTGADVLHMLVEGAGTVQARRIMDVEVGVERLPKALERPRTLTERDRFPNGATLDEALHTGEHVLEAEPAHREPLLQSLLSGDTR